MAVRDEKGRFVKGHAPTNKGKGGRRKRSTEEQYLKRMAKIVTIGDWDKVVHTAVARAKAGDPVARKWLSDYLIGSPTQRTELDIDSKSNITITVIYGSDG